MKTYYTLKTINAKQWFKVGDALEANIGKFFENQCSDCVSCGKLISKHGRMFCPSHGFTLVCPGDWIVKRDDGTFYTIKKEIFDKEYKELI